MFGFSGEHLLVLLVILLIFGPKRLPDLGHSLGRTLKNFKDAMAGNPQETPQQQPIPPASQIQAEQRPVQPVAAPQEQPEKQSEKV